MNSKVIYLKPKSAAGKTEPERLGPHTQKKNTQVGFDRYELGAILNVYGQMVSAGHWKDYALNFEADRAVFSIFRRASEQPLYRIEKTPALRNKQGQFCVIASSGHILKRGRDLKTVLRIFDKQRFKGA